MVAGSTWRAHFFQVGQYYMARSTFQSALGGRFVHGRLYELLHIGYSHYDNMSVFKFTDTESLREVSWEWFDHEPDDLPKQMFEAVEAAA
jgi:hypothetical protein